jgi:hypothetical protein
MMQVTLVERNLQILKKYLECGSYEETAIAFHLSTQRIKDLIGDFVTILGREIRRCETLQRQNPARTFSQPYTRDRYPDLYERKSGKFEFNSRLLHRGYLLAEKEFVYERMKVYTQNRLGRASDKQRARSAEQVARQKK